MKIVKYVIKIDEVPLLFNPRIMHSDAIDKGLSAGFAIISYDVATVQFKVKCFGGSDSLKISSNEGDCTIIQNYLKGLFSTMSFDSIEQCKYFDFLKVK